ncbi:aldo/keto reductase [Prosthecomicrobium sp. N25]|uniref:aldo/keto reductase n=1 Tax=Prosthecomicrobium sp. N25 TaxID=3129254 RepID=UPI00307701D6
MSYASPVPQFGLGTYGRIGPAGLTALETAIEVGYRHFDTAQSYGTEINVGEAIRRSGLPRSEVFVTTKVADSNLAGADFMPSVELSLATIDLGPVDLLLIHWPSEMDRVPLEDYVTALAEAQQRGLTRMIGVSNFPVALLERTEALLGPGAIVTNQVEIHPYLQAPRLTAFARSRGVMLTAYQPLAKGEVGGDPVLGRIAGAQGVTAAAVALAFLMAEGHAVIPASSTEANLRANFAARDVSLSPDEIAEIRRLDRGYRRIHPAKAPRWDD